MKLILSSLEIDEKNTRVSALSTVSRFFISIFLIVAILLNLGPVWAEQSTEDIRYAQDMILKGQSFLKKKRYRKAISYFKRSHARVPEVNNLFMIGALHTKLNECSQALKFWTEAQVMCGRCALSTKLDTAIIKHTSDCSVEISIQSLPRAQINIDGQVVGVTPYLARTLYGSHIVRLSAIGHKAHIVKARASRGRPISIDVTLVPEGSLLGVKSKEPSDQTDTARQLLSQPHVPQLASNPGMPAEDWLAAEELAEYQRTQDKMLKKILTITGVVLGVGAIGLYSYTVHKHSMFRGRNPRTTEDKLALSEESRTAGEIQVASAVLAGLSVSTLMVPLLFLD